MQKPEFPIAKSIAQIIETQFLKGLQGYRKYNLSEDKLEIEIHNPLATNIEIDLSLLMGIQTVSKEKGFNKVSIKWNSKYAMESRLLSIILYKK